MWEATGELLPARKTKGGTRCYAVCDLLGLSNADAPTVGNARVSSDDQKADLDRQHAMLEAYCAAKGWRSEIN
jgi:predicted site-specific integrase-resolvase